MGASNFFSELKRRQVYRGGVMYVVAGWVIVQVSTTLFPIFGIPSWAIRLVVVALLLGFPLALVALWMFDSAAHGRKPAEPFAPPAPVERRRNSDRNGDAIAQLMAQEREERQRANEQLIAAFDRLHHPLADPQHPATDAVPPPVAAPSSSSAPIPAPAGSAAPRRPRIGTVFIAVFTLVLAAWALWILVAPSVPLDAVEGDKIARQYVLPAYQQAEQVGAALLAPLLRKLGIGIAPERVFTALMLLIALLVLRHLYRAMQDARRRHRH